MSFDHIRTDNSDALSQRLMAHGYRIEPDYYPHTQVIAANRVTLNGLRVSYRVESNGELTITYLESQPAVEGENAVFLNPRTPEALTRAKKAMARVGLSQTARGLCTFLDFVIVHVPEIKKGKALIFCLANDHRMNQGWMLARDYRQRVTTERLRAFVLKWYGRGVTDVGRDEQGGLAVVCDFEQLRQVRVKSCAK